MIIEQITQVGNPIIRRKSSPVKSPLNSKKTTSVVKDLIDSMRYHGLIGIAAPQIGINQRIFVSEIRKTKTRTKRRADQVRVFINPKIISSSRKQVVGYEGCGSVAHSGLFGRVRRDQSLTIEAFDEKGIKFKLHVSGLLARIIQHEADHLDGTVFLDCLSDTKSLMSREEYIRR